MSKRKSDIAPPQTRAGRTVIRRTPAERKALVKQWITLRRRYNSSTAAAREIGVSEPMLGKWARDCGVKVPPMQPGGYGTTAERIERFHKTVETCGRHG